jgi:hypothetical protein
MKKSTPALRNGQTTDAAMHTVFTNSHGATINTYYHLDGTLKYKTETFVNSGAAVLIFETHLIGEPSSASKMYKVPARSICTLEFQGADMDYINYYSA